MLSTGLFNFAHGQSAKNCDRYPFIQRPISSTNSKTFRYHYQVYRPTPPGGVTLVYLPGGPGHPSMSENPHAMFSQIPESMGVILTDARGIACNSPDFVLPPEAFSTQNVAEDILAVIENLKLEKQKTILHGFSYGTVVATHAAFLNQQKGNRPFHSVVLEGVLGHYMTGSEYKSAFVREYQKYVSQRNDWIPFRWLREILQSSKAQGLFEITEALIVGGRGKMSLALDEIFYKKLPDEQTDVPTLFSDELYSSGFLGTEIEKRNAENMHAKITCTELQRDGERWVLDWDSERGLILKEEPDTIGKLCGPYAWGTEGYDSVRYQLREKLVYLQGENDPATPLEQSRYHHKGKKSALRSGSLLLKIWGTLF